MDYIHGKGKHGSWWVHQMETFSVLLAFVNGIHQWLVDSPHKGQWRGALIFSLICAWTNSWANNQDAGDLRHHHAHYDITIMLIMTSPSCSLWHHHHAHYDITIMLIMTSPSCSLWHHHHAHYDITIMLIMTSPSCSLWTHNRYPIPINTPWL